MSILGPIVKRGIKILNFILGRKENPIDEQTLVLQDLLKKAQNTAFGKKYNFSEILNSTDPKIKFKRKVPYHDYDKINDEWWHFLHEGKKDITWPGVPNYFALSSGTTGSESKKIPVTDEMLKSFRKSGLKQVAALANYDLPSSYFEKEVMMLGSSSNLTFKNGHYEGEISGITTGNLPFWFKGYYKPGEEISNMEDFDERVAKICENSSQWDIGSLSGIPSWVEIMLKKVMAHHNAKDIHEVWPNLQVFTSGGVAFEPYQKSFHSLMGKNVHVINTYLASEGFFAFGDKPDSLDMKLVTDNGIYYEFVPFKPEYIQEDGSLNQAAPSLHLKQVEKDVEYVMLISTCSGLWRYMIGDTVKFTDVEKHHIQITGRTKFFLNVEGSQLSVNKMDDAIKHLEEKYEVEIHEYTLASIRHGEDFTHYWHIGLEEKIDADKMALEIDKYLQDVNKNYKVARTRMLKNVVVIPIDPDIFFDWNAHSNKKGGQVKMERLMSEDKYKEWRKFVIEWKKSE